MAGLLDIADLSVVLRDRGPDIPLLRRVSLAVSAGEVSGLVGESGAGKSMIGRAILGILPRRAVVVRGTITYAGDDLLEMSPRARRRLLRRDLALIPQDPLTALNPSHTVGKQVGDALRRSGFRRGGVAREALRRLDEVRIAAASKVMKCYPHELSGGMRQRVLIACAFACEPRLIVADEPTTALDVTVQKEILKLVRRMQRDHGVALLFITHDLGVVAKICTHTTVLHGGRVVESAPTGRILSAPGSDYARALLAATPRHDLPDRPIVPVAAELTDRLWQEAAARDV